MTIEFFDFACVRWQSLPPRNIRKSQRATWRRRKFENNRRWRLVKQHWRRTKFRGQPYNANLNYWMPAIGQGYGLVLTS